MKNLTSYQTELKSAASRLGLYGDHVDVICNILSYALYTSEIERTMEMRELSLTKSTTVNSKIQRAVDRNYSVHRGHCPLAELWVLPRENRSLNRGDLLFQSADFNFYVAEPITLKETVRTRDELNRELATGRRKDLVYSSFDGLQKVIVRVSREKKTVQKMPSPSSHYIEVLDSNVSQDIYMSTNNVTKELTRNFRQHQVTGMYYDMTLPDFGVRLYKRYNPEMESNPFTTHQIFEITYYKYFDDMELLNERLQFLRLDGMELVDHSTSQDYPRETADDIEKNALSQYYTNSMIRSNTDVMDVITMLEVPELEDVSWSKSDDGRSIKIHLLPKVGRSVDLRSIKDRYIHQLEMSYYILPQIEVDLAASETRTMNIDIYTYLNSQLINENQVNDILKKFTRKLGGTLDLNRIRAEISKIENVNYCTVTIAGANTLAEEREMTKKLPPEKYYSVTINKRILSGESIYK